jgi:hypothetical protein
MPPRRLRKTPEERSLRIGSRMSPGSAQGRIESASPVRSHIVPHAPSPFTTPPSASGPPASLFVAHLASNHADSGDYAIAWTEQIGSADVSIGGVSNNQLHFDTDGLYAWRFDVAVLLTVVTDSVGVQVDPSGMGFTTTDYYEWSAIQAHGTANYLDGYAWYSVSGVGPARVGKYVQLYVRSPGQSYTVEIGDTLAPTVGSAKATRAIIRRLGPLPA